MMKTAYKENCPRHLLCYIHGRQSVLEGVFIKSTYLIAIVMTFENSRKRNKQNYIINAYLDSFAQQTMNITHLSFYFQTCLESFRDGNMFIELLT